MKQEIYTTPCIEQVEIMLEQCIAASVSDKAEVSGVSPENWEEENLNTVEEIDDSAHVDGFAQIGILGDHSLVFVIQRGVIDSVRQSYGRINILIYVFARQHQFRNFLDL